MKIKTNKNVILFLIGNNRFIMSSHLKQPYKSNFECNKWRFEFEKDEKIKKVFSLLSSKTFKIILSNTNFFKKH